MGVLCSASSAMGRGETGSSFGEKDEEAAAAVIRLWGRN